MKQRWRWEQGRRRVPIDGAGLLIGLGVATASAQPPMPAEVDPGVTFRVYQVQGEFDELPQLAESQTPNADELRASVDFGTSDFCGVTAPLVSRAIGWVLVTEAGPHEFRVTSDDGSRVWIGGRVVIDHDGRHAASAKASGVLDLSPGANALLVEHFDAGGSRALRLEWKPPGAEGFRVVPREHLRAERDHARVVSPGVKAVRDRRRPGDGRPVAGVHPAFDVVSIAPPGFEARVGAMAFAGDGRLIVGTFDPLQRTDTELPDIESKVPDKLYALAGVSGDPAKVTVSVAADGLFEPSGLCAVGDELYVSHRRAITKLSDRDRDGFYETRADVASGWEAWNYHQFTFGLVHRDGKLYAALSTAMAPPGWEGMGTNAAPNGPMRGTIIEVDLSSNWASVIAGGVRTPNGIGLGPGGSLFYADNQGTWMPTNQIGEVVPGRFFGHFNNTNVVPQLQERFPVGGAASAWCDRVRSPAAVWLPQNEFSNSPTQPLLVESGIFAGQMLVGELTGGGVRRVALERINGQWQGAAFQFTQGLSVGINRMAWGPDGALYVGGIGAGGNWNWNNTKHGLDRLTPNGRTAFEMLAVRALAAGLEIEFTKPVPRAWLGDPANYTVTQWRYAPTKEYGGPKVDEEVLRVGRAAGSGDGRRVTLEIAGLREGSCVSVRADPVSVEGEPIWSTTAYYTLNHIPRVGGRGVSFVTLGERRFEARDGIGVGAMCPERGAVLIGRTTEGTFTRPTDREGWPTHQLKQAELMAAPEYAEITPGRGDMTSRASFGDARLHVEWYCPRGGDGQLAGNSGVFLQDRYEIQVLGTSAGAGRPAVNEAGAIYNVKAADVNASAGPGTWQAYDVWFRAPRFVNGVKRGSARVTMFWNGVRVHDNVEIPGPTGSASAKGESEHGSSGVQVGPIRLQDHASAAEGPVRYRNVWIAPLDPGETPAKYGDWQRLSAREDLAGWVVRGGNAAFEASGGVITARSVPNSPNTFLVTEREYGDFELLLELKQDSELNSGIQIRSRVEGGLANRAGRVIGYQVEADLSERGYSGGIYDEGRRGWLLPLVAAPYARNAYRPGEWNRYRIVAHGAIVQTWINGVPAACVFDALDGVGHVGLQVHGVGERRDELRVQFRNVRIRERVD